MVDIDLKVLLVQTVTFLIGLFILWQTGFKYLLKVLEARRQKIESDLQEAKSAREAAEKIKADFESQLNGLRQQGKKMLDEAAADASRESARILDNTRVESKAILEKSRQEIARETEKAKREIKDQAATLALLAVEKVVGQSVDAGIQ